MVPEGKFVLPDEYKKDIEKAIDILKNGGCRDIFLFGSVTTGNDDSQSDIDLAITGCPRGRFFHLLGKLLFELNRSVDLINLDNQDTFSKYLEKSGELRQIE
ncbi:nucleotidyltransferase domain-containing protein [candidate division KSB1 bacterium]|nr:nucleotidyltransferase domain-containing protein [candidate division KSB1 bacterium]